MRVIFDRRTKLHAGRKAVGIFSHIVVKEGLSVLDPMCHLALGY